MGILFKLLSYPKSILGILLGILWTLIWSLFAIVTCRFCQGKYSLGNFITYWWAQGLLIFFNIKVDVEGRENLQASDGIFLFNHCSHFDIPIIFTALKGKTARFGAKTELFKIPFFGGAMRAMHVLEIHRGERERVLKLYQTSLKNVEKGMNYILAPEGTRQPTGLLGKFKSGPFIMAIAGQVPVKPLVISGAQELMPKGSRLPAWGIWRPRVKIRVLPAVSTKGYTLDQRQQLMASTREQYQATLSE